MAEELIAQPARSSPRDSATSPRACPPVLADLRGDRRVDHLVSGRFRVARP